MRAGVQAFEAFVVLVAVVAVAAALYYDWRAETAQCGLRMSLDGSTLFMWSQKPAAYKVLINGTQVWPCPVCIERGRLAVPLGGPFAEVAVATPLGARKLYAARLSNGTYVFAWDGKKAKSVCIP